MPDEGIKASSQRLWRRFFPLLIVPPPHSESERLVFPETRQKQTRLWRKEGRQRETIVLEYLLIAPSLCLCPAMSRVPVLHVMMIVIDRTIEAGACSDKHRLAPAVKLWTFGNWRR